MPNKARLVFLAIDSLEPSVLQDLMAAGDAPVLAGLCAEGLVAPVESLPGFSSGALWPTLVTGVNPARHGRYFLQQIKAGTYRNIPFNEGVYQHPPVWEIVSDHGRRVCVIDMYKAPHSRDLNGMQISEWVSHDALDDRIHTWPENRLEEVRDLFGESRLPENGEIPDRTFEQDRWLSALMLDRIRLKSRALEHYLAGEDWSLFMGCWQDLHDLGHQFWHCHDKGHPEYDPDRNAITGDPYVEGCRLIDAGIGRLLAGLDADTTVMVFAGGGMECNYSGNHLLDDILRRLDPAGSPEQKPVTDRLHSLYRGILPHAVRQAIRRRAGGVVNNLHEKASTHDLAWRSFFAVPNNDNFGAVRVNLAGREPAGKVRPGAEYEEVLKRLSDSLMALVRPGDDSRLVTKIIRVDDICDGPDRNNLPDLLVGWDRTLPITGARSPETGEISRPRASFRTGDHSCNNLLIARGPEIATGNPDRAIQIMDIAATIGHILGVDIPDTDGRVIPDFLVEREPAGGQAEAAI